MAALFKVGDERIKDLIQLLDDENPEISLRAQVIIRYLGNDTGIKELLWWYEKRKQYSVAGPVPVPLHERDYQVIYANYIGKPLKDWYLAEPYIYALFLDDSPKSKAVLEEMLKSVGKIDISTVAGRALEQVRTQRARKQLIGRNNLADLVIKMHSLLLRQTGNMHLRSYSV